MTERKTVMRLDGARITEKAFQAVVLDLARLCGWKAYHTFDSRRSEPGFPDLVLVPPAGARREVIFAELKSTTGKLTPAQKAWLEALSEAGAAAVVWRPSEMDEIREMLEWRP